MIHFIKLTNKMGNLFDDIMCVFVIVSILVALVVNPVKFMLILAFLAQLALILLLPSLFVLGLYSMTRHTRF